MIEKDINKLIGNWKFTRNITDNTAGLNRSASGKLTITKTQWREIGEMDSNPFFQTYKLDTTNNFTVLFNDKRLFYELKSINHQQTISHICGDDLYNGVWNLNDNKLLLQWNVKGKNKDYIMNSVYTKIIK